MKATLHIPLLADTLMARELELEKFAADEGASRYEAMSDAAIKRGEGAQLRPAERMCGAWYSNLKADIAELQASCAIGEAGVGRSFYGPVLAAANLRAAAAITLHEGMSHAMLGPNGCQLSKVAYAIGSSVVADIHVRIGRERKADMRDLHQHIERFSTRIPQRINKWARESLEDNLWNRKVCSSLGLALAWRLVGSALLIDDNGVARPAFGVKRITQNNKGTNWLYLRSETQQLLAEAQIIRSGMRPRFNPMVVPPLHWGRREDGTLEEGGHYKLRTPFVVKPSGSLQRRLKASAMPQVFSAINNVSGVAWQIDPFVVGVVDALLKQGGGIAGLPKANPIPLPPRPTAEGELKLWKREAANIHESNKKSFSARQDLLLALGTADSFMDASAIWYPHQLDFRGRAYPVPLHLNHVAEDPRRAMLRFAKAVPVADDRWLRIHAANCWGHGIDKASFDERVEWVRGSASDIERFQSEPLLHDGWMAAENPFQFLAACRALCDSKAAARLPVHQDGSCNGLQHYAAMGRDEVGGASVNLTPGPRPADVYAAVAAVAASKVRLAALAGNEYAKLLDGKVDRKVVKQPTMTSVYGVTRTGVRDQLEPRLVEKGVDRKHAGMAAHWLSSVVMESIGESLRGAATLMQWLRSSVKAIVKSDNRRPIEWTTPLGFPVLQPYWNLRIWRIHVDVGKYKISIGVPDESSKQHLGWAINGVAANFVHSCDASHMMMTANHCAREGIDFAAVHDSFWSHAAHAPALAKILREEFVILHSNGLVSDLRDQWQRRYGNQLEELPAPGNLKLSSVLDSEYFFS
jgi:DNA-directed RNA polymerase